MNVLILAGGQTELNLDDGNYPLCLTELDEIPLIQRQIQSCSNIDKCNYIFALTEQDVRQHHLDQIIHLLEPTAHIVTIKNNTRGAACTALLAIGHINNSEELLILNGNEFIDIAFHEVIISFRNRGLDAGAVIFPSIHPRYSYLRLDRKNLVIEAAEKRPISRHATAGFYWFSSGTAFVQSAQSMIQKDAATNNNFYICPVFNELILQQARIGAYPIETKCYHPLKTIRQIMRADIGEGDINEVR